MPIKVFDFFAGCGGTSKGFQNAGCEIVFALDDNEDAELTFKANFPESTFLKKDIRRVFTEDIKELIEAQKGHPLLFCGCAPCQPFSKQNGTKKKSDERTSLLLEFLRFVEAYKPEYIFIENVPGIQEVAGKKGPFQQFVKGITALEYHLSHSVVDACEYGVPQRRRRLVLLASLHGTIAVPTPTHGPGYKNPSFSCVKDWIGHLPPIAAGEKHLSIRNHQSASLSDMNLKRIMATPVGKGRESWPEPMRLVCHSGDHDGHGDVYGRLRWEEVASCLTTRCISLSNGRFGHPDQHRAISAREAACLQTFPETFIFHGSFTSAAQQIGNAVPVLMAEKVGTHIKNHFDDRFGKQI